MLVVLAAAVLGGRLVGVVAGVVTALAFDFFLTVPYGSFSIDRGDDVLTTALLAAVGLIGGALVERARRGERMAEVRGRRSSASSAGRSWRRRASRPAG